MPERPSGTAAIRPHGPVHVSAASPHDLATTYADVPIAFEVREVLDVVAVDRGLGGLHLVERALDRPWIKDYDAEPGNHPSAWPSRFDVRGWHVLGAWRGGARVGGAVVVHGERGLDVLGGDPHAAALWDLRVLPAARGAGVGAALFDAAAAWARGRGARRLVVETQTVNVPACRFYARRGCTLAAIRCGAYSTLPDEAQLVWVLRLG